MNTCNMIGADEQTVTVQPVRMGMAYIPKEEMQWQFKTATISNVVIL